MNDQALRPLQLAKNKKESIEASFDSAISSLERVNHSIIDLIKKGKIQKKTLLKKSNKLMDDSIDLLIDIKEELGNGYNHNQGELFREETTNSD
jgi:hypothetical protein